MRRSTDMTADRHTPGNFLRVLVSAIILLSTTIALPPMSAAADDDIPDARKPGSQVVRERQLERETKESRSTGTYWSPFELARQGRCAEALDDLKQLANLGRGYESAQHVYGRCLIELGNREDGLGWVRRAANAGLAAAQATHLELYLADGIGYMSHETAAMWLYLYENNPLRLRIGARARLEPSVLTSVRGRIPRDDYLAGISLARSWTPTFVETQPGEQDR